VPDQSSRILDFPNSFAYQTNIADSGFLAIRDSTLLVSVHEVVLEDAWAHRQLSMCVRSYEALPAAAKSFFDHLLSVK
jgi:hypothetical protein